MIIVPEMIGSIIGVYNGKTFNQVEIKVSNLWHIITFRYYTDVVEKWKLKCSKCIICNMPIKSDSLSLLLKSSVKDCLYYYNVMSVLCEDYGWFHLFSAWDDWPLSRGIQHHIQTCEARSSWYWCHPQLQIYTS